MSEASGGSIRRSLYASFLCQWIGAAAMVVSSLVVARLLTPKELGVFTVALGLSAIVQSLQNVGGSEFVLYTRELDIEDRRSIFGVTLVAAVAVGAALLALSGPFSHLYGDPAVAGILMIFGMNVVLQAFVSPMSTMLARGERFTLIGLGGAISALVQSGGAIALILAGFSSFSLALAGTCSAIAGMLFHLVVARRYLLVRPSFSRFRRVAGFSATMFFVNIFEQIYNAVPPILIGRINGLPAAAMYGRASIITQIYGQVVQRAVEPVVTARIAAARREGGDGAGVSILASAVLIAVSVPFFGFVAVYADVLVPWLFGPQWGEAVLPMRILCAGFALWPIVSPTTSLLIASGGQGVLLRIKIAMATLRVVLVGLGALHSLPAAAAAVTLTIYLNVLMSAFFACRLSGETAAGYLSRLAPSLAVSGVALAIAGVGAAVGHQLAAPALVVVVASGLAAVLGWLVALVVVRHPLHAEFQFLMTRFNLSR